MSSAVEVARILDRLDQLSSIHRAESLGIVVVSAAAWAFFHGLLRGLLDYTGSGVICPLSLVIRHWSFVIGPLMPFTSVSARGLPPDAAKCGE
jgi:hypothetical protein